MRRTLLLILSLPLAAGCHCSPSAATPLTVRVKNATGQAIWVDDTTGELGVELQQQAGSIYGTFSEAAPCACQDCSAVCNACDCSVDGGVPMVLRVDPGMSIERSWPGNIETPGIARCGSSGVQAACFTARIPAVDEKLNAHLCYSPSAPGVAMVDAGVPTEGSFLPTNRLCVDKLFRVEDGVVEVGPVPGSACTTNADCTNPGELCFGGTCSAACPANQIPQVGGGWQVAVPDWDDQGLLSTATNAAGQSVTTGTGVVGTVHYSNGTMTAVLKPADGGTSPVATIYVTLPAMYALALPPGQGVALEIIDASTAMNVGNRAISLRDLSGNLLLAAEVAQEGPLFSATDTAPFAVTPTQNLVGCDQDGCGKLLHFTTVFDGGSVPAELPGGGTQRTIAANRAYLFVNVANNAYAMTTMCAVQKMSPYAILYQP